MAALTLREQFAGFPVQQMLVVSLMRFSEPLAFTSLFPYLYFMIRDFHFAPTEQEISKYLGYLALSFAFCQFMFAVYWGKMLNRVGRKPVLLCGLLGTATSLVIFGFSTNYYMALFARSIAGALNGNIAVLRTVIGELCVERRHQALGFSTLPLLFNFGAILGPLIGGSRHLTRPSEKSPYQKEAIVEGVGSAFVSFRQKHPYALSNIVVLMVLVFSCMIGFLFLEETNELVRDRRDIGLEIGDEILYRVFGRKKKLRPWIRQHEESEQAPLLPAPKLPKLALPVEAGSPAPQLASPLPPTEEEALVEEGTAIDEEEGIEAFGPITKSMSNAMVRRYSLLSEVPPRQSRALTPRVVTVILSNCIISLHSIAYNEFLPVFLAARFQKDQLVFPFRIVGGFGLDSLYIGTLFSSTGVMGMLIVLIVFPFIDRHLGTLQGFRLSLSFFPVVYACVPLTIFTLHKFNAAFPPWFTPVFLYSLTSLKTLASATGMPQVMLLNHRAAEKQHRAYVNSLTMSMLALARSIGPIIFGYLMTLGDSHNIAWLAWWVMALLALFGLLQSFVMHDYNDD